MSRIDISDEAILRLIRQLDHEKTTEFLADTLRLLLINRETLRDQRDAARTDAKDLMTECCELRAALERAIDYVDLWSCYAAPVYKEKHDLEGNLLDLQTALKRSKP